MREFEQHTHILTGAQVFKKQEHIRAAHCIVFALEINIGDWIVVMCYSRNADISNAVDGGEPGIFTEPETICDFCKCFCVNSNRLTSFGVTINNV